MFATGMASLGDGALPFVQALISLSGGTPIGG
jgi:hypothetical protein